MSQSIRVNQPTDPRRTVLVIGGGVAGMRSAGDLAEAGLTVYLVENTSSLGGRVAQLGYMFPTHDCVLCRGTADHGYGCTRPSISPAFQDHNMHPNIHVLTLTNVIDVQGQAGDFHVTLLQEPRYVDVQRCTNCGLCAVVCPVDLPSGFQAQLAMRKAAYKSAPRAIPNAYIIDKGPYCQDCGRCVDICPTDAIDLEEKQRQVHIDVGAIILAVGYSLTDANEYEELGYGRYPNVLHSMEYERLASRSGPTEGIVLRPSDTKEPKRIAWLQCVGSRDQKYPYCSSICCMYATKEAMLARQRIPDVETRIFMMDERAFNKEFNAYYIEARDEWGVEYTRCRISEIKEDPETHNLILRYPDEQGKLQEEEFDMVILSVGTRPPRTANDLARQMGIELNPHGFCQTDKFAPLETSQPGVYVCGTFASPKEIAETFLDAAGAAGDVMRFMSENLSAGPISHEYPFLTAGVDLPAERDVSGQDPKIGVFICRCIPSLEGVVDTESVEAFAKSLPNVAHVERLDYGCMEPDLSHLRQAIGEHGLNRVVVAACSHRTHEPLFQRVVREAGLNPYLMEMANIREHCAWVHVDDPPAATRKAKELVRMAVVRVERAEPVIKLFARPARRALIVGGGVSGMQAALNIADAGYEVTLVERDAQLGGNLRHIYFVAEGQNPQRLLRDVVNRVRGHTRIDVMTRSEIKLHTGRVGDFRSIIETQTREGVVETEIRHGVTIVATGGQEWRGSVYMYGEDERVITQLDMEEILVHRPEEIVDLEQVVMIQCVRPPEMVDYCSRTCCTNTMKNAMRIKMLNPDCQVIVLYKDIITYGFREQYYTEARRHGVVFVRYDQDNPVQVSQTADGRLQVRIQEESLAKDQVFYPDLLALSMATVPSQGTIELAELLEVPLSSEGFFLEAHLKMRPMDFVKEGLFIAGMAHYPKFIEECLSHAQATAARAISILSQEPLFYGGPIAVIDQEKCVGCLTCVRTCPFGIPKVEAEQAGVGEILGAAYIDPALCQGCGTCTAECPAKAIQLVAYRDEQLRGELTGAWACD